MLGMREEKARGAGCGLKDCGGAALGCALGFGTPDTRRCKGCIGLCLGVLLQGTGYDYSDNQYLLTYN